MAILTVTDNAGGTDADTATVTITAGAAACPTVATTICGRWVDATGATITSATTGQTIFLELDIRLVGENVDNFQTQVRWTDTRLSIDTLNAASDLTDLNCSATGGQATCPSGPPPAGNVDRMNQFTGQQAGFTVGRATVQNYSLSGNGTGIQGLAKIKFTVGSGSGSEQVTLAALLVVGNNGMDNLTPQVAIAPIMIN
jgi:hypothetical protein